MMSYSYFSYNDLFQIIENDFNNYSHRNNLNVTLKMEFFSEKNSTRNRNDHSSTIDSLLSRKSTKYDIYIFDPIYLKKLSSHFLDLKQHLPEEYIDSYSLKDIWKICVYEDKWVGLPLFIKFMVLYSNTNYLKKYNEDIPTTWDKLLEVGENIVKQERNNNNNMNFYGYNGLFPTSIESITSSMCSIYQYIYSNRDNVTSSFPKLESQLAIDALNKMKEIKNKISSDEVFKLNEDQTVALMREGKNILFTVFWDSVLPSDFDIYKKSILPGRMDGISGSCLGGYNIGISNYINEENKRGSIEVFKFIFSKEFQKEIIIKKFHQYSGIIDLYKDEEICSILKCDILNSLQLIERPITIKNYETFEIKFINYFYDFLYGSKSAKEALQSIEDITKIYYMDLKDNFSYIIFIIINVLFVVIVFSLVVKFIPKYSQYYQWLNFGTSTNYIITSFVTIYSMLAKFGEPTEFKCHAFLLMILTGYALVYTPTIFSLITYYPKSNRYFKWIKTHENLYICQYYIIEGFFFILAKIHPSYKIVEVPVENSKSFYQCRIDFSNKFGIVILSVEILFHLFLYVNIIRFLYIELNNELYYLFAKVMSYIFVFDSIGMLIVLIIRVIDIKNYYIECIYPFVIIGVFVLKHIYLLFIRVLLEKPNLNQEDEDIIKQIRRMTKSPSKNNNRSNSTVKQNSS